MRARIRLIFDYDNGDTLGSGIFEGENFQGLTSQKSIDFWCWCYFGTKSAALELQYYIRENLQQEFVVYQFPVAWVNRANFISALLFFRNGLDQKFADVSYANASSGVEKINGTPRSLKWIELLTAAFSGGQIINALQLLKDFRAFSLQEELGDLSSLVADAGTLCARILKAYLELLHPPSKMSGQPILASQLVNEGYFRYIESARIHALNADLSTWPQFERKMELISVLATTRKFFLIEAQGRSFGIDTNRVLLIQTTFFYRAALDELAMGRPSEAFGLLFKGFECLLIWENLAEGKVYFYGDRVLDATTHQKFSGFGALFNNVSGTLKNRVGAKIYADLDALSKKRNALRVGHGLAVPSALDVEKFATALFEFIKSTAKARAVMDYHSLLADSFAFSGVCGQIEKMMSQKILDRYLLPS